MKHGLPIYAKLRPMNNLTSNSDGTHHGDASQEVVDASVKQVPSLYFLSTPFYRSST